LSEFPPLMGRPQIVLQWLTRLRWLAAIGQVGAVAVCVFLLQLDINISAIAWIIFATVVSNIALELWWRWGKPPGLSVPCTIGLDVILLTGLLYYSGGSSNPFAVLYVVHVVMAVVALGPKWTWAIAAESAVGYGLITAVHEPLGVLKPWIVQVGNWSGVVLVSLLIAYYVGQISQSLRRREAELAVIRERSARMEMLASLTTLAAGAAHELGTPLGTIAIVSKEIELFLDTKDELKPWADDARLIRKEVDRCRNILERMRVDVSDELRLRPAQLSIAEFVRFIEEDLSPHEWAKVRVSGASEEIVRVPSRAMRQALNVLLRNALEVSPEGEVVELRISRDTNMLTFEVEDHGEGMDEETARRAGEPFFTTKPVGKGMGLGLFLVRMVAEQTKGQFSLDSRRGVGTRTRLSLPLSAPSASPEGSTSYGQITA
jgi:two-component system, sensor histidine kinase RegB